MMKALLALAVACSLPCITCAQAQTYTFTTIAGAAGANGSADGTNDQARFRYPSGLAVDGAGNLYVADTSNHTIRKITPSGTNWVVTTIAGTPGAAALVDGTNSDARFNRPNGLALDTGGNLFVVDHYNHAVRMLSPSGTNWVVTTIAGGSPGTDDGVGTNAHFQAPTGIAVDAATNLYVVDTINSTIRQVTPTDSGWSVSTIAGAPGFTGSADGINGGAEFFNPYCVAVDAATNLYVTDWGNHTIRQIQPQGPDWATTTIAGTVDVYGSTDGLNTSALFNFPNGIAVDGTGSLFIADQFNHTIRKLTLSGTDWVSSTLAGKALSSGKVDGTGDQARFNKPFGIAVDSVGRIFVADYNNSTIRMGVPATVPPLGPALQIAMASNNVVVSWPTNAADFTLETSAALTNGVWTPVTDGILQSGDSFVLTNTITSSNAFYRLRK